jgi:hypothetical protein|tara:strand:+ start:2342 stop:2722 length:381 start_codon:yes stop_codon:yes gene_type:complete
MPGHNPRKVKKLLKKIFKGKSADKGLQELSDENYQPGKTPPNRTPQTDVMGRPMESSRKGTPQMRDSEGRLMTPGEQRRAIRRVRRAERKEEKAKKKAKKKEEKKRIKASRINRTPQTDVMGRRIG